QLRKAADAEHLPTVDGAVAALKQALAGLPAREGSRSTDAGRTRVTAVSAAAIAMVDVITMNTMNTTRAPVGMVSSGGGSAKNRESPRTSSSASPSPTGTPISKLPSTTSTRSDAGPTMTWHGV